MCTVARLSYSSIWLHVIQYATAQKCPLMTSPERVRRGRPRSSWCSKQLCCLWVVSPLQGRNPSFAGLFCLLFRQSDVIVVGARKTDVEVPLLLNRGSSRAAIALAVQVSKVHETGEKFAWLQIRTAYSAGTVCEQHNTVLGFLFFFLFYLFCVGISLLVVAIERGVPLPMIARPGQIVFADTMYRERASTVITAGKNRTLD